MMRVGDERNLVHRVTREDVEAYASISGDNNLPHMESEFSKKSSFDRRISHGKLIVSFFTGMIALDFPGSRALQISQEIHFKAPVFVNGDIQLQLVVKKSVDRAGTLYLSAKCHSDNRLWVDGMFKVYKGRYDLIND
jgi:3-hydroxybutyryl-CoA dehydratase